MDKKYYMYVLKMDNGSLYCGYTDDVERRFQAHQSGTGAKFTKAFKPKEIIFTQEFETRSEAMKAECKFKSLTRVKKFEFIETHKNSSF